MPACMHQCCCCRWRQPGISATLTPHAYTYIGHGRHTGGEGHPWLALACHPAACLSAAGLDDARNIAAICRELAARGIALEQTNKWNSYLTSRLGA